MNNKEKFSAMLKKFRKGENGGTPNARLWFCGIENMAYGEPQKKHNFNLLNTPEYTKLSGQDLTGSFNKKIKYILEHLGLIDSNVSADEMYKSNKFYCTNLFPLNLDNGQTIILCSHPRHWKDWSTIETNKLITEIQNLLVQ